MKTQFKIIIEDNDAIVLLNNSRRITDVISDVEKSISKKKYFGIVTFDLLLSNGIKNRFFEIPFENNKFELSKIKKVEIPKSNILAKANDYYLKNEILISNSSITRLEKRIIRTNLELV